MGRLLALLAFVTCLIARPALAQDPGSFGVTMGYPASVGVLWHFAERVALRPEDVTRVYVAPRYAYSRATASATGPIAPLTFESTTTEHSIGLSIGAHHQLGEQFALFGELGHRLRTIALRTDHR